MISRTNTEKLYQYYTKITLVMLKDSLWVFHFQSNALPQLYNSYKKLLLPTPTLPLPIPYAYEHLVSATVFL
ncbi:hypothetical protein NUACC26_071390 [Scytonema sp. NUACC26]